MGLAALSASEAGPITYRAGRLNAHQLAWIDRSGKEAEPVGDADSPLLSPALSPDGRRVVVGRNVDSNWDLWLIDIARALRTRLTSDPALDNFAVWSPDGSRIAFSRGARGRIFTKALTGTGQVDPLLEDASPTDWSSDGQSGGPRRDPDSRRACAGEVLRAALRV